MLNSSIILYRMIPCQFFGRWFSYCVYRIWGLCHKLWFCS